VRLLLDTHIALWWVQATDRLPPRHREVLGDPANTVYLSSIVLAEIAVKQSIGKLSVPDEFESHLHAEGLDPLSFTGRHARTLRSLPLHHRDPFDRMLLAQAIADDLVFVTADSRAGSYAVRLLP